VDRIWNHVGKAIGKMGIVTAQLAAGSLALMVGISLLNMMLLHILTELIDPGIFSNGLISVYLLTLLLRLSIGFCGVFASVITVYLIGRSSGFHGRFWYALLGSSSSLVIPIYMAIRLFLWDSSGDISDTVLQHYMTVGFPNSCIRIMAICTPVIATIGYYTSSLLRHGSRKEHFVISRSGIC
jgi:hypothetical protein